MTTLSSDNPQFYIPESRRAYIKQVEASTFSSQIAAIEGSQGIGKTVMLEEVLTQTLPDANKCYVTVTKSLNDIQIRSRIIEQLFGNVLFDPEMPLLTSFIEFNQPLAMVIAIDNAHYLSGRIIGELLQLYSESKNLGIRLSIILSFDRSISSTLLNIKSSLIQVLPVPSLTKQESYQFLKEYIADIPEQTSAKVKRWIDNSAGIPIQLLAYDEQQNNLAQEDTAPLNIKLWGSVLVVASLILAISMYIYRLNVNKLEQSLSENQNITQVEPTVRQWPASLQQTEIKESSEDNNVVELTDEEPEMAQVIVKPAANAADIFSTLMNPNKINSESTANEQPEKQQTETSDLILAEITKGEPVINADDSNKQEKEVKQDESKSEKSQVEQASATGKEIDASKDMPESESSAAALSSEPADVNNSIIEDDTVASQETINQTTTQLPESSETIVTVKPFAIDNDGFLSLPSSSYVLQITAVSSELVLAEFLASSTIPIDSLSIYKISRNGSDWIVVTYGLFDTIEQARAEATRIAPTAWAKSISVIQQQINSYNRSLQEQ